MSLPPRVTCPFTGRRQKVRRCPMCGRPVFLALNRGEAHPGRWCEVGEDGKATKLAHPCKRVKSSTAR